MKVVMDLVLVDNDMGDVDRTREAAFRRQNLFVTLSIFYNNEIYIADLHDRGKDCPNMSTRRLRKQVVDRDCTVTA